MSIQKGNQEDNSRCDKVALLSEQPVTCLKGVGPQLAERLAKLGIATLQDLLFHLPFRYIDRTRLTPIGHLRPLQQAVIEGEVQTATIAFGKRRSLLVRIKDNSGHLSLRFFYFSGRQKDALCQGVGIRCFGEPRLGATGIEMYHPEYQLLLPGKEIPLEQYLTPIYSVADGITQARLRQLIEQVFQQAVPEMVPDLVPNQGRVSLLERLRFLHFPPQEVILEQIAAGEHPYQKQLIREELLAYQLSMLRQKEKRLEHQAHPCLQGDELIDRLRKSLPFELTGAQQAVSQEITADIARPQPMMRLVQGDVGSGKTIVAAMAALRVVASGLQVAVMAPTDILAEQHRESFTLWFESLGIRIGWLSGKLSAKQKRIQLEAMSTGTTQLVVGTHALFQSDVAFADLGLVIIDEQHRFGVHQRLMLRDKGRRQNHVPHQLIMTATPIPRTLAMSAYSDLDYSVIDELPRGRIPVQTVVISQKRRPEVIQRIQAACAEGRQAYWVCTLIEESEELNAEAAEERAENLMAVLPNMRIGLVHGRLKSAEKETVMADFKAGAIQVLVATTVIEVGVNVPNASLMIIENPERLGLAQLHQLRGRIGRGSVASHCVLLYGDKLSQQTKARLKAMRETSDGFKIAEIDLSLRGPGEVLGTRQTGEMDFKVADLQRDLALLPKITEEAKLCLQRHPHIARQLIERWIGESEKFAHV